MGSERAKNSTRRRPAWGKIIAVAIIVTALAAAWRYTPLAEVLTPRNIASWTKTLRGQWWSPLALLAIYLVGSCILFPRPLMTLIAVVAFGVRLGLPYGVAGVMTAAMVTYAAGRLFPERAVRRIAGDKLDIAAKKARRHGVIAVFAANMTPVPPFVVQNVIAGALRIPVWEFALGTLLACLPGVIGWSIFGSQVNEMLEDGGSVNWWIVAAGIAAFCTFLFFVRRWIRNRDSHHPVNG